ncbi:MAG TPA: hypothetical protein VFN88_04410 [Caulobacteraceae bacterium]|nr:hypothetical protein [Caulobacteraceae bacterium]
MTRELLGGIAGIALLAGGLAACDRHQNVALQNRTPQEPASAPAPQTELAQADTTAPAAMGASGPTVPVMTPTGNMNPAVRPGKPSERSTGASPQMTPTGEERPAYTPPRQY